MAERGRWVTPDGKEHKGIFYGSAPDGNRYYDIPDIKVGHGGNLYGHWESDGEVETVPEIRYGKGG